MSEIDTQLICWQGTDTIHSEIFVNMDDSSAQLGGVTNSSQLGGNGGNSIGLNKQDGSNNANSHEQSYTMPGKVTSKSLPLQNDRVTRFVALNL